MEKFELCEKTAAGGLVFSRAFETLEDAQRVAHVLCEEHHGHLIIASTTTGEIYGDYDPWDELMEMGFRRRTYFCLTNAGIETKEQLMHMSFEDLKSIRNLGPRSVAEILRALAELEDPEPQD